jgi:predicted metalloprotease with PDZ domain
VRSRTISQRRYERALAIKRRRAQGADKVLVPTSTSEITAKAVMLLVALDKRIREVTAERASLDDVLVRLTKSRRPITTARLRRITEKITRRNFQTFFARIR